MEEYAATVTLYYRSPLILFGITPAMKDSILEKIDQGDSLSPNDLEAVALTVDSMLRDGEEDSVSFMDAFQILRDAALELKNLKCAAVFGATVLYFTSDRRPIAKALSLLAFSAREGLGGAAYPLSGWYADRIKQRDLDRFDDTESHLFDPSFKLPRGNAKVAFPKTLDECRKEATQWAFFGLSEQIFECDETFDVTPPSPKEVSGHLDDLEKAALGGSFAAKTLLTDHFFRIGASPDDHTHGIRMLRTLVNKGHEAFDCFALSKALEQTIGEQPDATPEEVFKWCLQAAEGGCAPAMRELSFLYQEGRGVEKNSRLSYKWLRRGAEAGDGTCRLLWGKTLLETAETPAEKREAVRWIRAAAEEDDIAFAWLTLADCYTTGEGLYVNKKKAAACRKRAEALWGGDETVESDPPDEKPPSPAP